MDIIIVGAGIGGLAAAGCLIKDGHRVRVFEQAGELAEVGAGIQISANAVKVLKHLGLGQYLEEIGVKPKSFQFRRFDTGEMLHTIPLGESHLAKHGDPYYQVHRADLHRALADTVRALDADAIKLGVRAVSVDETDDRITVAFENHPSAIGDLVIGADGIKSMVRKHIVGTDDPVFTGQVAWRCTVPIERIAPELRTDILSTIWCGPHNHAVTYYVKGGSVLNFVGCVERPWEEESWTANRPWEELDEDYRGWHPMVRAVIDAVDRDRCYRWALNNRTPLMVWSTPRATMLGDAVHATLPYMAQGAAMAIEDAAVLARSLALPMPLAEQLRTYEKHRAPRTAQVVFESTEMGQLYQIQEADEMRQAFIDRNIAKSRNEWLYPYDPMSVPLG